MRGFGLFPSPCPSPSPSRKRQSGQAAVFVYVFLAVVIVAMAFLYKAGKLTSDKMALQNAADAAAYSVSVIEARDLNFASYMNRAIVANEVAMGQLVGLVSWAYHWRSFNDYISLYARPLQSVPDPTGIVPGLGTALITMAKFLFKIPGDAFVKVMTPIATYGTLITHNINKFYGWAEFGYHLSSTLYALGSVAEMIDQNAPAGARLSDYGMLSLIGHMGTFGAIPGLPGEKFTRNYDPTKKVEFDAFKSDIAGETDAGGYGRLSALIHDSSDPFVKHRGWEIDFFKLLYDAGLIPSFLYAEKGGQGWLGVDTGDIIIPLGIGDVKWRFWIQFHIDLARTGGSELRLVSPLSGTDKEKAAGQFYNWSSADTTNLGLGLDGGYYIKARACLPLVACTNWFDVSGSSLSIVNDRLVATGTIFGQTFTIIDQPFPTKVPFGAGFAQSGIEKGSGKKKLDNFLDSKPKHMGTENSIALKGPLPTDAYGGAANALIAWEFPYPPGIFYQASMKKRRLTKKNSYGGLPRYTDTLNNRPLQGSGGSNLVVGVMLGETEFDLGNPAPGQPAGAEVEPAGRFKLTEKMARNQLHVLAKSEVHFKRPLDLGYYARGDGQEEFGSTFNPYWQARLVETSHADRSAALMLQQGVDMQGGSALFTLSGAFQSFIKLMGL